jgi:putative MATE family efflux protein
VIIKDREFYRLLLKIAIPICLQSIINIGVNLVDTILLGRLGETALSAAALANQYCLIFLIINFGIAGGAGVLTGQYWGKNDIESINKVLAIALKITTVFALVFFLAAQLFSRQILGIYSTEPAVIEQGSAFLRIISFSFLFQGISTIAALVLRTVGVVRLTMITAMVTFVNNLCLNWVFIFGNLGMPALGVSGSALATSIARTLEVGVMLFYLFVVDRKIKFRLPFLRQTDRAIFRDYLVHGAPVLVSDFVLVLGLNMLSVIMGRMGSDIVAANAISNVVYQFTTVLLMGISSSSAVIIGNTVGARDYDLAQHYGRKFLLLSIGIGLLGGLIIFSLRTFVVDFYQVTDGTKQIALQLMNTMAILIFFSSISTTLTKGVLRAGGDTRFLMIADVLFLWLLSIPLGYLAGLYFGLAPGIVLIFLKIDEVIKAVWCSRRLMSRRWIKDVTLSRLPNELA